MPVLDLTNVKQVFLGDVEATALYLGGTKVWEASGIIWDTFLSSDFRPSSFSLFGNNIALDDIKLQSHKIAFADFIDAVVIRGNTYAVSGTSYNGVTLKDAPKETIPATDRIGLIMKEDSYYKNPSGKWYSNFSTATWENINSGKLSIPEYSFKSAKVNPYNAKFIRFDGLLIPVTDVKKLGYYFELNLFSGIATMPSGTSAWLSKSFDLQT